MADSKSSTKSRLLWFVALWAASVLALASVGFVIKLFLGT